MGITSSAPRHSFSGCEWRLRRLHVFPASRQHRGADRPQRSLGWQPRLILEWRHPGRCHLDHVTPMTPRSCESWPRICLSLRARKYRSSPARLSSPSGPRPWPHSLFARAGSVCPQRRRASSGADRLSVKCRGGHGQLFEPRWRWTGDTPDLSHSANGSGTPEAISMLSSRRATPSLPGRKPWRTAGPTPFSRGAAAPSSLSLADRFLLPPPASSSTRLTTRLTWSGTTLRATSVMAPRSRVSCWYLCPDGRPGGRSDPPGPLSRWWARFVSGPSRQARLRLPGGDRVYSP